MRYLLFTLMLLSLAFSALAQTPTGTLQGTVVDESGAVMPHATVRVTSETTNETKTLTTDSLGAFFLPFVTPGTYTLSVTRQGFNVLQEKGIEIQVDQIRALNLVMKVGAVTQTVEVQGTAPRLDTQTGTLGQVVDTTLSMDMPLLGRDPISLAKLAPAVNQTGYADNPHLGGSRNGINEEQLDGVSNILPENNLGVGTVAYTPIVDSVQEFSVETNALSAEYGRFGGGVINMVTKQGTNRFHGDGFEFAQNAALDANDFFSNSANAPIPASHENQYGGTAGGPIDIPHVYNGHDRTFFFFGFQATQQESATNGIFTVPTPAFRAGNFATLGTTIYDPLTINPATDTRTAFTSNQIPQDRWDPVGAKAMSYFPLPNYGAPGAQTHNYFNSGSTLNDLYQFDIRVDHTFSAKWQSFLRFSHNWSHYTTFSQYNNPASPNSGPGHSDAYSVSMDHTFTLSPTLILDLRYGLSRNATVSTALDQGFNPSTELGFPSYVAALASQRVLMFPDFFFSNGASLGNIYSYYSEEPTLDNFVANVTKVKGHHTLKFGGELRTMWENFAQYGYPDGGFDIDTTWTQLNPTVANGTGSPYADLLLGLTGTSASVLGLPGYTGSVQTAEPSATDHSSYMGYYIQDNWKLTKKLTVNLGLRWELEIPRTDRFNQLSYWNPNLPSPLAGLVPASACLYCGDLKGQMLFVGDTGAYGRHQVPYKWTDIGPRFGLAWTPTSKTVIRSGFGIVYDPSPFQAAGTTGGPGIEGFSPTTPMLPTTDNELTIHATLSNPFPTGYIPTSRGNPSTDIGNQITDSWFNSYRSPYSIEWNFNIQRELPGRMTLEVGYLGNHGLFLPNGDPGSPYDQVNPSYMSLGNALYNVVPNPFYGLITTPGSPLAQPTVTYNQLLRPYPQYTGVEAYRKPTAMSMYNGFTVRVDKRFSNGLQFIASLTGSKTMDNAAATVTYLGPTSLTYTNQYDGRLQWAVSPQDISRSLYVGFVYQLPLGKGRAFLPTESRAVNALVSGWEVNGILNFSDGNPLIMSGALNETGIDTFPQQPDCLGDAKLSHPTIQEWFNTSVFIQPPPFTFGTCGRTIPNVRNPGYRDGDLSLFKNIRFGHNEQYTVQVRTEWFNALNNVNWGVPNTNIQAGSAFGAVTSDVAPRHIQLAVKFLW